jgi:hypothetical protein
MAERLQILNENQTAFRYVAAEDAKGTWSLRRAAP